MTQNKQETDSLKKIHSFYESVYYTSIKPIAGISRHLQKLTSKMAVGKNQHVLDVGCGTGTWLLACDKRGAIPHGVDISQKAIAACKSIMPEGQFYTRPAESLPFGKNMFDLVTCLGALEHFVNPDQALKEIVRVAKQDAKILILVPNANFLTRRLGLYSGTNQAQAREKVRTLQEWNKLFERSGLVVKERWRDLHVLSGSWILSGKWYLIPLRAAQALVLAIWPIRWQYQVYHLCSLRKHTE